jgi:prophage regulatory protein
MANQVLRPPASAGPLSIKISTFYDHIARGILPATIKFAPRAVGHPSHGIDAIISARIAGKSEDDIKSLVTSLMAPRKNAS